MSVLGSSDNKRNYRLSLEKELGMTEFLAFLSEHWLGISGIVGTCFFGVVSFIQFKKIERIQRQLGQLSWGDLITSVRDMVRKIKNDTDKKRIKHPDMIFCPSTRAATIANLFLYEMGHDLPLFVGLIESPEDGPHGDVPLRVKPTNHTKVETNKWNVYIPEALLQHNDRSLLIVDDITITGTTLHSMLDTFKKNGFRDIITAVPIVTEDAILMKSDPDYWWKKVPNAKDFRFPWGKAI